MLPKPYYDHAGITIYHGDCRDILPDLPPVDLVLTDPPYGKLLKNHSAGKHRRPAPYLIVGDNSSDVGELVINYFHEHPIMVFASPLHTWSGSWGQVLVWDKGPAVGGGGDYRKYWKFSFELILTARLGVLCGERDQAILKYWNSPTNSSLHIAQKPIKLIRYLISKTMFQTILDPFMGSGTTLVAAKQLNRKAIGIEIEEKYCQIAVERLSQEVFNFTEPEQAEEQPMLYEMREG